MVLLDEMVHWDRILVVVVMVSAGHRVVIWIVDEIFLEVFEILLWLDDNIIPADIFLFLTDHVLELVYYSRF